MVLIDSYTETADSYRILTAQFPLGSGALAYGQTFRPALNYTLTSCKFSIRRSATALTGNLKAYLYTHTGTFGAGGLPTGSPLATSNPLDLSTLTTSFVLYTFIFDDSYTLIANTAFISTTKRTVLSPLRRINHPFNPMYENIRHVILHMSLLPNRHILKLPNITFLTSLHHINGINDVM